MALKITMKKYGFHLSLLGIWAFLILFIGPSGDFPINDDWAYAQNAKFLTEDGVIYFSYWPAMTLFAQTLWATAFCKIFGFSFVVLRWATLVLALGTSFAFFELLKRHMNSQLGAFMMTLILISSPLFIAQSFTFMTEIYYLFFGCMSLIFYSNYFKNQKLFHLVAALVFTILMLWVRQTALILPVGFGIAYLLYKKPTWRSILVALIPTIVGFLGLVVYKEWRVSTGQTLGALSEVGSLFSSSADLNLDYYIHRISILFYYAGFAMIPVSILIFIRFRFKISLVRWIAYVLCVVPVLYCMISVWDAFPNGNVLNNFEIGPKLLKDAVLQDNINEGLPDALWSILRVLSILSVLLFIYGIFSIRIIRSTRVKMFFGLIDAVRERPFLFMMIFIMGGQFLYLTINPIFFDRYIIPLAFSALVVTGILLDEMSKKKLLFGIGLAGGFLFVSAMLMSDFMSWQRTRWQALNYLTDDLKIEKNQIDGGFEFNAWHQMVQMSPFIFDKREKSWWWVDQDNYLITSGDFLGYHKFKSFPTERWISSSSDTLFILQKTSEVNSKYPIKVDFESYRLASKVILDSNKDALWDTGPHHTKEAAKSGKYSVRLGQEDAFYYQLNELEAGEIVKVSVWCKGATGKLIIDNHGHDEFENIEVSSKKVNQWQLLEANVLVSPEMAGKDIVFYLSNTAAEPIYFDDVTIARSSRK